MRRLAALARRALPSNRFARSVSVLLGGTAGSQAAMVLAAPVLTRLYTPEDLGMLAVFAALLSLASVMASLRYELAIPLPEEDNDATVLLVLGLLAVFALAALAAVPIMVWREEIASLLAMPRLADYLFLLPAGILLGGMVNVLTLFAVRMKAFGLLAQTRLSQSLTMAAIQIGGAFLGPVMLLFGQIVGQGAGSFVLCRHALRKRRAGLAAIGWRDIVTAAVRYRRFPLFSTWSALFNTAGWQLPPLLFATLFGPAAAGMYALANRVLSMPMQLLGQAIASVFFSDAAAARRDGRLGVMVAGLHRRLAHIGMPPMLLLMFAGPDMFEKIFGPQWREAGMYARWLTPWLYLVFVASPLSSVYEVLQRQAAGLLFQATLLACRIAAIAAGAHDGDARMAVILFALASAACWLVNLAWILHAAGNRWTDMSRTTLSAMAWAALLASPFIWSAMRESAPLLWMSSLAAACLLIAIRYAYLLKSAWS